jgi:hypothetical protein
MLTRFMLIAACALISTPALAQGLDYQTGGAADQAFHDNYVHNFGEPPNAVNGYNWAQQRQMEDAGQRQQDYQDQHRQYVMPSPY